MNGFWVIVRNSLGCEIERQWADSEDAIGHELVELLAAGLILQDGDTIAIEAGWSEEVQ